MDWFKKSTFVTKTAMVVAAGIVWFNLRVYAIPFLPPWFVLAIDTTIPGLAALALRDAFTRLTDALKIVSASTIQAAETVEAVAVKQADVVDVQRDVAKSQSSSARAIDRAADKLG